MADLYAINPRQLDAYWPDVLPFIEAAMNTSLYDTTESVYRAIEEDRAVLWIGVRDGNIQAVCVTQLELTEKVKVCSIWIVTGKGLRDYIHLYEGIEAFAKAEGCAVMRHKARPGYTKLMKKYGYRMTHAVIEKVL